MQKKREELIKERDAARAERAVSFCFIRFGCFVRFVMKLWAISADDSLCCQSVLIVCLTAVQVCVGPSLSNFMLCLAKMCLILYGWSVFHFAFVFCVKMSFAYTLCLSFSEKGMVCVYLAENERNVYLVCIGQECNVCSPCVCVC